MPQYEVVADVTTTHRTTVEARDADEAREKALEDWSHYEFEGDNATVEVAHVEEV